MKPIDLLLPLAMAILFFMGFFVGYVLPPNVRAQHEGGKVTVQHVWIKPTSDITYLQIGDMRVRCEGTVCKNLR